MVTRNTFSLEIQSEVLGRASTVFHFSDLIPFVSSNADAAGGLGSTPPPDDYMSEIAEAERSIDKSPKWEREATFSQA